MPQMSWLARQDGYDPNAFDVPGEQSTGVGWANRMGEILTTRPTYDETVQYKTASPLVNITEGDIGRATEAAMAVSGGGMKVETPKGIRAYHSSPHDFDKFDLSKIGTGEGAQVYGHGLYFAENPKVSGQGGQYWQQFLHRFDETPEYLAAHKLKEAGFNRADATALAQANVNEIADALKSGTHPPGLQGGPFDEHVLRNITKNMLYNRQAELDLLRSDKPVGPRTYEVNINADPAHMLDWDKAIGQQPHVIDALKQRGYKDAPWPYGDKLISYEPGGMLLDPKDSGESVYRSLSKVGGVHANDRVFDKAKATQALQESGIPGIKYLDQGSRTPSANIQNIERRLASGDLQGLPPEAWQRKLDELKATLLSSNYVIFDPSIIRIDKKYAVPGAIGAGGMGALAAQDRYEEVY
jgi:hypothetical protein